MGWWKSLQADWRKLRRTRAEELGTLLEAVLLLPLTRAALLLLGLRRWQATLSRFSGLPTATVRPGDDRQAQLAARCVAAAAARFAPGDTCLSQAVVLWWLLRRRGLDSGLHIGVRKSCDRLEAHAWIEYRGTHLGARPDTIQTYRPFSRAILPAGGLPA
jgi:hypothetical protein